MKRRCPPARGGDVRAAGAECGDFRGLPATLGQVIRFKLSKAGFEVALARHGQEALERLAERPYDLVVTDEIMPIMTGRQLCEQMQQSPQYAGIPIVMLTVKVLQLNALKLRTSLGVIEVHPKPFSPTVLLRMIQRVLDRQLEGSRKASGSGDARKLQDAAR